ncbi:MAG: aldehyde dehydrogenase family protein [Thermodesulfovibrionia bacterium]|nr:aldehyde dehydrogenase family protein [Thermodesulfovibrionia bacterium]
MKPVLLLVDLQNDFLRTRSLEPAAGKVIERASALLAGCRSSGIPVIHIWTTVRPGGEIYMPHWKRLEKMPCIDGTEGHAVPISLQPVRSEKIVHKAFFSAFEDGVLDNLLDSLKSDTILIAGLYLHGCIRATVLDAYQRGYKIFVAEDAVSSNDPLHSAVTRRYLEKRAADFIPVCDMLSFSGKKEENYMHGDNAPALLPAMVIADAPAEIGSSECFEHISPRGKNESLWRVPICGDKQVSEATSVAYESWLEWRDTPLSYRAEKLRCLSVLLEAESRELSEQMAYEIGKPVAYGEAEVARSIALLKAVSQHASDRLLRKCSTGSRLRYRPQGVIAAITPWNNPLAIPLGKIAPALIYGNTVVWKPALEASSIALRIMNLLKSAGCQPGTVNLVCGNRSTASALMYDERVDAVTLTGSLAAGYSAQDICAGRHIPLQAELGGNNASIVCSDYDLKEAALKVAEAAFGSAGQRCTANRRVIVMSRCYDDFLKHLIQKVRDLAWGDPIEQKTQVGPLISSASCSRVDAAVSRAMEGARDVFVPHRKTREYEELACTGMYYPPTIICCDDNLHEIVQEETFGPVLVVQRAIDWDHAVALCNGVKQGLVASVFTASKRMQKKFLNDAQAGILKINSATADAGVEEPFGGWKASGIGPPEHGVSDREFYTRTQTVYY